MSGRDFLAGFDFVGRKIATPSGFMVCTETGNWQGSQWVGVFESDGKELQTITTYHRRLRGARWTYEEGLVAWAEDQKARKRIWPVRR